MALLPPERKRVAECAAEHANLSFAELPVLMMSAKLSHRCPHSSSPTIESGRCRGECPILAGKTDPTCRIGDIWDARGLGGLDGVTERHAPVGIPDYERDSQCSTM